MAGLANPRFLFLPVALFPLPGYEKSHFQTLFVVQARIAKSFVIVAKLVLIQPFGAARAFGYIIAGEFQVYRAKIGTFVSVNGKGRTHFFQYIIKIAGFYAAICTKGVAMHGVAAPHHGQIFLFHGFN